MTLREIIFNLSILYKANPNYEMLTINELHPIFIAEYSYIDITDLKQATEFIIFGTIRDIVDIEEDYELLNRHN
jgi:hypothetical protein